MSSIKIFNKGARDFLFHGIRITPDKFTEIPAQHAAAAEKLLKDYPNELLSADSAPGDVKAASAKNSLLEKEVVMLRGQVEKLQKLLISSDASDAETALRERAETAEAKVKELEDLLLEATDLNRKVDAGTAAPAEVPASPEPAPASDATTEAPASEPAAPAPAAPTGKSKKNR